MDRITPGATSALAAVSLNPSPQGEIPAPRGGYLFGFPPFPHHLGNSFTSQLSHPSRAFAVTRREEW
ncbi:hypothetical protein OK074_2338 [Actinobacteria bacterium OK074]|nr:hypothetical protein OK074_2338 [Actinobacteria bacterium OK074]